MKPGEAHRLDCVSHGDSANRRHDKLDITPSKPQTFAFDRREMMARRLISKAIVGAFFLCAALGAGIAGAQSQQGKFDPKAFAFEVIAVHPDGPDSMSGSARVMFEPSRYEADHVTVKEMVREAYGVDDLQISGDPRWMDSASFSVDASIDDATMKALDALNEDERAHAEQHMLQALLADRFHLVLTLESKERPAYLLTLAKGGIRLRDANPNDTNGYGAKDYGGAAGPHSVGYQFIAGSIQMTGQAATMDQLVSRLNQKLSSKLGRLFVNDTGLTGNYDFELDFHVPWVNQYGAMLESTATGDSPEFSLSPAMKQLGLNIKPANAAVQVLTIMHVEQLSEN
jgi:uncharacterized protein (TIGR03435 family)